MLLLSRFGTLQLPAYDPGTRLTVVRQSGVIALPGGATYDALGTERARRSKTTVTRRSTIIAGSRIDLDREMAHLLSFDGKRDKLWGRRSVVGPEVWAWARMHVEADETGPATILHWPVELSFEILSPCWYGAEHDDTTVLNTSPKTIAVANAGNTRVTNAILTVTAGTVAITAVKVGVAGVSEIQWAGTLAAAAVLVIDCGALSVKKAGLDAYSGFSLTANHKVDDWLRLEPGNADVVVTPTGGDVDSTFRRQYWDGWE